MSESDFSITEHFVQFDGVTITIFDPKHDRNYIAKLADCRWFVGGETWVTVPCRHNSFYTGTGETLLIVFPDSIQTPEFYSGKGGRTVHPAGPAIAAVGFTPETRLLWEQAIARLNVVRDEHLESLPSPMSQTFLNSWAILALAASVFLGLCLSSGTHHLLTQWNVPIDIATGISFSLFMPGVFYILCFLSSIPFFWRTRQVVHQVERGIFTQLKAVFGFVVVHIFIIGAIWSTIDEANNWTARSAIAATVFCVVMAIILIVVSWRFLAEPNKEDDAMSAL